MSQSIPIDKDGVVHNKVTNPLYGAVNSIFIEEDFPEVNSSLTFSSSSTSGTIVGKINDKGKAISVMMTGKSQNFQTTQEQIFKIQEQLEQKEHEMAVMSAKMQDLQAQLTNKAIGSGNVHSFESSMRQKDYMVPSELGASGSKVPLRGGGYPYATMNPLNGTMNPALMAMIDEMVRNQVKKIREKEDEGFQMMLRYFLPVFFSQISRSQNEALCLQLFVQSLEGPAFTWYANLSEVSITNWGSIVKEFIKQFYNTRRRVRVPELIDPKRRDNEPVTDFISRLRALTFACKERLTQDELLKMYDEHNGEWVVYESKRMRKKKSAILKFLNVGHITSKEKPRRSKGSKKKRTKVGMKRQIETQKKKKSPKNNSEDLVSDELLVQTHRSLVTLKDFMPAKLQAPDIPFFSDKVNEDGEFSAGCMVVVIISDDESEEEVAEGSASNPFIVPDSLIYWWDTMINESLYVDDLKHQSMSYYKDSEIEN
ncbi:hypothetical protein RJ640_022119 [Escallonia rubra]|uniref:Retrotransposon gag domain-containing protein n=1 Tax=Escallonia rubra TaxID=112253 RepID=A0AA88SKT4_9ASTE|nr:hypothetical protein RJ640_022119 [Escallonia rubra]